MGSKAAGRNVSDGRCTCDQSISMMAARYAPAEMQKRGGDIGRYHELFTNDCFFFLSAERVKAEVGLFVRLLALRCFSEGRKSFVLDSFFPSDSRA